MTYMYPESKTALRKERERNGYTEDEYYVGPVFTGKRLKTIARNNTHFISVYGLGYGWRFAFPSVEFVAPTRFAEDNKQFRGTMYLHLEDGRSLTIERDYDKAIWKLEEYNEHDIVLTSATSSSLLITYKDGRKASFSGSEENMRLQYMEDRFGNRITFAYTSGRLSQITDTMGRVLKLKETASGTTKTLYWQQEDTGDILFKYTVQNNLLTEARAVTKQAGSVEQVTTYEYTAQTAHTTLFYTKSKSSDNGIDITYQTLAAIRHPSGARTEYTYNSMSRGLASCMRGTMGSFAIRTRKDFPTPANRSIVQHEEQYSFSSGEMALTSEQIKKIGKEAYGASFTSMATVEYLLNGVVEKRVVSKFERKNGLLSSEELYHVESGTAKLVSKREIKYEFETTGKRKLPVSETVTAYDVKSSASMSMSKGWTYDGKDNVTAYTETYPQDTPNNQSVAMTYDLTYCLSTGKTVTNTSGTIREEYVLTTDKKLVAEKKVYDGSTLKERIGYVYDAQNRLIKEKRYYGTPIGTTTDCYETDYVYGSTTSPEPTQVQLSGVKDADGSLITSPYGNGIVRQIFTYDWYGRRLSATDPNGNVSSVEYDTLGRKVKEINADATFRTTAYDDANNCVTVTDENGHARRFAYTPLGKISKGYALTPETLLFGYTYDHLERVIREASYGADGTARLTITYTYNLFDQPLSKTFAGTGVDAQETYSYDQVYQSKFSRAVKTIAGNAAAPNVVTETVADRLGRTVSEKVGASANSYTYDKLGNKLTQTDPRGNVTTWAYDYAGRVVTETNALGKRFFTTYDALGRKTKATDPKGHDTLFTYDAAGRLLMQESPFNGTAHTKMRYFYDAAGNTLRQETLCSAPGEAETWRKAAYLYDSRSRVTDAILYEADGSERRSRTVYDPAGNKLEVYTGMTGDSLVGAQKSTYTYDRFNKALTMTDPMGQTETYSYDVTGRLLSRTDRKGVVHTLTYDALDRMLTETATAGTTAEAISHTYTKTGQKLTDQNTALTVTNAYDAQGRLISQSETGGVVKAYTYDVAGNRAGFTLTKGGTQEIALTYGYDNLNRLSEVKRNNAVIAQYAYDDNGNWATLTYPQSGIAAAYIYNDANLVVSLENKKGTAVLSSFSYTYDLDDNQKSKTDKDDKVTTYVYDSIVFH